LIQSIGGPGGAAKIDRRIITPDRFRLAQRILVVDDEANIVVSLEFLLKRAGFEVAVASEGDAALAALASFGPQLVLLDVMMPGKSGFEICQAIRELPEGRGIKILMLTAKGRASDVSKGLALGADVFIVKPFSTRDLLDQITRLLGGAQ